MQHKRKQNPCEQIPCEQNSRKPAPYSVISEDEKSKMLMKPCGCKREYLIETTSSRMIERCIEHETFINGLDAEQKEFVDEIDKMLVNITIRKQTQGLPKRSPEGPPKRPSEGSPEKAPEATSS